GCSTPSRGCRCAAPSLQRHDTSLRNGDVERDRVIGGGGNQPHVPRERALRNGSSRGKGAALLALALAVDPVELQLPGGAVEKADGGSLRPLAGAQRFSLVGVYRGQLRDLHAGYRDAARVEVVQQGVRFRIVLAQALRAILRLGPDHVEVSVGA